MKITAAQRIVSFQLRSWSQHVVLRWDTVTVPKPHDFKPFLKKPCSTSHIGWHDKKHAQAKERVTVIKCKATAAYWLNRGSSQWGTSHPHPNFQVFLLFFPSNSSSVHHFCHTICKLFSISRHLCINSTSASARRGSLSLLEQASSTALAHYSHDDDRGKFCCFHISDR